MVSGRDTLKRMSKALRKSRRSLDGLDRELKATSAALAKNGELKARTLKKLAAIRLDAIKKGEIEQQLDSADRRVRNILERRERAIEQADRQTTEANETLYTLEDERDQLHEQVDEAAKRLAECEAAVQRALENDPDFEAQLNRTREADAIAVSAAEKAELAAEDRQRNGTPFEDDELFMYLWNRAYGTAAYRANPLTRMLDAWVARKCRYKDARPNYWMLQEIPKRLRDHAGHARDHADRALDVLQDIEAQAAIDGGVPEAREALEAIERRQDTIDERIAAAEADVARLQLDQGRYSAGLDKHIEQALGVYAFVFDNDDVNDLTRLTRATMSTEDDELIEDLRNLRRNEVELRDELEEHRARQLEHRRRVDELEQVRRDFKRSRYDDVHSRFEQGDTIERMIGELVTGVIGGGTLWNVLRRYQHYSDVAGEWPDFGSGGILGHGRRQHGGRRSGRPARQRAPSWHWPDSGRSGGGFKMPKSPRSSRGRGGFRTGGGV